MDSLVGGHLVLSRLVVGNNFDEVYLPDNFETTIVLPSLKFLCICVNSINIHKFSAISAPALEFLTLEQVSEQDLVDIFKHPRLSNSESFLCLRHLIVSLYLGQNDRQTSWSLFCSMLRTSPCY
jgi:hypothetical protein